MTELLVKSNSEDSGGGSEFGNTDQFFIEHVKIDMP